MEEPQLEWKSQRMNPCFDCLIWKEGCLKLRQTESLRALGISGSHLGSEHFRELALDRIHQRGVFRRSDGIPRCAAGARICGTRIVGKFRGSRIAGRTLGGEEGSLCHHSLLWPHPSEPFAEGIVVPSA